MRFIKPSKTVIHEKQTDPSDPRLKNIVQSVKRRRRYHVGIVGIPFDLGVKNSGGRVGAALAPDAIRSQMKVYGAAYNVTHDADLSKLSILDFGNVIAAPDDIEETHNRVTEVIKQLRSMCDTLIVLGGGNDLSFATIRALAKPDTKSLIGGMNVDAHLDVREVREGRINSGTPYRRLLEHGIICGKNFFEVGIQGHTNSKVYWDWAKEQGIHLWPLSHMRDLGVWKVMSSFRAHIEEREDTTSFVSIDIDSVAQAFAPGSSSPSPDGLFPKEILEIAFRAGAMPSVRLFEIMEVNPKFDQDNRTARLAVNIILEFLAGYTKR